MMIRILFFGRLSDRFGGLDMAMALPDGVSDLAALKLWLEREFDAIDVLSEPSIRVMVNKVLVHDNPALNGDEEIGFLPPVGGG